MFANLNANRSEWSLSWLQEALLFATLRVCVKNVEVLFLEGIAKVEWVFPESIFLQVERRNALSGSFRTKLLYFLSNPQDALEAKAFQRDKSQRARYNNRKSENWGRRNRTIEIFVAKKFVIRQNVIVAISDTAMKKRAVKFGQPNKLHWGSSYEKREMRNEDVPADSFLSNLPESFSIRCKTHRNTSDVFPPTVLISERDNCSE